MSEIQLPPLTWSKLQALIDARVLRMLREHGLVSGKKPLLSVVTAARPGEECIVMPTTVDKHLASNPEEKIIGSSH